jgi:subtilisin-like proprotein convertase family protein
MYSNVTPKRMSGFLKTVLTILGMFCLMTNSVFSQQYVNGNLSTGVNSSNGQAAPAGFTWSEVQTGNANAGFGANIAASLTLADDFTVNVATWTVTKMTFYGYSTGYSGATSPFNDLRLQIFNTDPSVGTPTPIFGNLTTNRLTSSSSAGMYRIFPATTGTTRQIWKLEASINVVLPPGTYWVEWQSGVTTGLTSNFSPSSTVVGTTTQPGNNAKQHDLTTNTWSAVADGTTIPNNFQDFPFVIDYGTNACTGTPDAGNTLSSVTSVCPNTPFNLGISNVVNGLGITYQWQSSTNNVTYTDITGATSNSYSATLFGDTWYRCAVTCGSNGNIGYSTPIQVTQAPISSCYCTSSATDDADEDIFRVKIGTLDNSSTCASVGTGVGSVQNQYSSYASGPGAPAPGVIISGGNNPLTIQIGTCGGNFNNATAVWIDYNRNGNFEATEKVYVTPQAIQGPHIENGSAFIPASALSGITLMRVVTVETFTPANITPCGTYNWGETEDYLVDIRPCVPAQLTSQPTAATTNCGGSATFSVTASGDNPSYVWEYRTTPTAQWAFVTEGGFFSGSATRTLSITGASSSLNGYQFRVLINGSCSATDFSSTATLTVSPLVPLVTPTSATICNGTSTSIQINNAASASVTTSVASGTLGTTITDSDPAGILTAPINISGIPANAVISDISVKFNISHTWVGDLDINLVAPNGGILNLVGALNGGTGSNGTDDFTNTVISSTSTTAISGAANPRTGVFAAEKRATYGPTGYPQPAGADWSSLTGTLNGDWKLAIADFATGDEGTLNSWEVIITYTSPVLAEGTYAPTTGLFTDAALTTAYTGGSINTVYAAPTTSTNYTVIVQTPLCTSSPLVVPVTVANPISGVANPDDAEICDGDNATFTSTAAAGNPITYQWQVSTDAGATWANVSNGTTYAGATTNTLTVSNASTSLNGNEYRLRMSVSACNSTIETDAATLTVNANPSISLSASPFTSIFPGLQSTLNATVNPAGGNNTFAWTYNGSPLTTTSGSYVVDIDRLGTYAVMVTDQNGCKSKVSNSITITDSLNTNLFVYPNPNNGQFQVRYNDQLNGVSNPRSMNIYDAKGSRVYRKEFTPAFPFGRMEVDLRQFGKGVYMIDLNNAAGERLQSGRVVVQ